MESEPRDGGPARCDLRGLRVDEALDRLAAALDDALARDCAELCIVHGVGTGALLRAVRAHLRESPYVTRFEAQLNPSVCVELNSCTTSS